MLAIIYRFTLIDGKEESFASHWHRLANYLMAVKGALGSTLHRSPNGQWLAYSRWPSREVKESGWPHKGPILGFSKEMEEVVKAMQACIEKSEEPIYLDVVADLLLKHEFNRGL